MSYAVDYIAESSVIFSSEHMRVELNMQDYSISSFFALFKIMVYVNIAAAVFVIILLTYTLIHGING
jgi:hypothetical protein